MVETAKVSLVTLIAAFELQDRLVKDLHRLGVRGYTFGKVEGRGVHGPRMAGLADAPNLRIEVLVTGEVARGILDRVSSKYGEQPIIVYVHEVEALPPDHFS